jgi:uncharacterized protein YheU (UPF0270 family)
MWLAGFGPFHSPCGGEGCTLRCIAARNSESAEVPYLRLPADVLRRVIEEFVTREGTEYGASEKTLAEKVTDVRRQLDRNEATIVYDAGSETINIVRKHGGP